jgi:hypothetical protein
MTDRSRLVTEATEIPPPVTERSVDMPAIKIALFAPRRRKEEGKGGGGGGASLVRVVVKGSFFGGPLWV